MNTTENIWNAYHNQLYAFIQRRANEDIAEDILQDVFLKIHTKIDTLQESTKLESWLYQITRNAIIDYYRSKKTTLDIPEWIAEPQKPESENIQ